MRKCDRYFALFLLTFCSFTSRAQTFKLLFSFDQTDGAVPNYGTLAQGTDGALYGTTIAGGSHDDGVAFRITTKGKFTVVQNFCPPANCTNGAWPRAGMVLGTDGNLYGTTEFDTFNFGNGTIYRITRDGTLATVHNFDVADGSNPQDTLIEATDGAFYGTTTYGGAFGYGTVFRIASTGTLKTIHSFNISDGSYPIAGLVQTDDGSFWGTTVSGGAGNCNGFGCGTLFRITRNGTFSVVHSFDDFVDGQQPYGTLMQGSDGSLYGTTHSGGLGWGTVFKVRPDGRFSTIRKLHASDGGPPLGKLVQATDGNLYGTTSAGGPTNAGTIFQMKPDGTFTTVHYFDGFDGASSEAGLLQHTNGKFYGTTGSGGGGILWHDL